jgi:hypothetical protein
MLLYHFGTRDGLLTTPAAARSAFTGPLGRPYLRLFGRLHDTAGQPLALAVIRGLLMDLDATGDAARTNQAFPASSTPSRSRRPDIWVPTTDVRARRPP